MSVLSGAAIATLNFSAYAVVIAAVTMRPLVSLLKHHSPQWDFVRGGFERLPMWPAIILIVDAVL